MVEAVGPLGLADITGPLVGDVAGKEENGGFLLRLLDGEDISRLHYEEADVHLGTHIVHGSVDISVITLL